MLETPIRTGRARRSSYRLSARLSWRPIVLAACAILAADTAWAATPIAYVTSEKAGIGVIDLDKMTLEKTFSIGASGPRGLSLNHDGTRLIVADKNTDELAVIDTRTGKVVERVKIGKNPEYVRVHDGYAYVTYEPGQSGEPPGKPSGKPGADDEAAKPPAEIAIVDMKTWRVIRSVKSGHETEGVEFSRDGKEMLVTNEGDDTVVVLDANDFHIVKTADTKLGPYGVAYGPDGQRLFVAAARDKTLQVFDAHTYDHIADAPIGQRCWHFSFTPDGTKLLLACGRSDAVYVLDAKTYALITQIGNLPVAWGIVTYPPSDGSIESR